MLSPLCLLLLVRPGDYIVTLCVFYFYKLIGKLTAFLQLQEFSLRNMTMVSSTTAATKITHSPITLAKLSSINLVSIFRLVSRTTQCMRGV